MEVLLDTSFILSCVREKVDFTLADEYGKLLLAREVIQELEKLASSKRPDSNLATLALKIIDCNKEKFRIIELENEDVDSGIIEYARAKKTIVATMDARIKKFVRKKQDIF